MSAIDDLQRISILRDNAANAHIKVESDGEDPYWLTLKMVGAGGNLRIHAYGLHAVVCTFRAEIMRMILLRLEAQMRELLPAAQEELAEIGSVVAEPDNKAALGAPVTEAAE